jgi:hypothetical protein
MLTHKNPTVSSRESGTFTNKVKSILSSPAWKHTRELHRFQLSIKAYIARTLIEFMYPPSGELLKPSDEFLDNHGDVYNSATLIHNSDTSFRTLGYLAELYEMPVETLHQEEVDGRVVALKRDDLLVRLVGIRSKTTYYSQGRVGKEIVAQSGEVGPRLYDIIFRSEVKTRHSSAPNVLLSSNMTSDVIEDVLEERLYPCDMAVQFGFANYGVISNEVKASWVTGYKNLSCIIACLEVHGDVSDEARAFTEKVDLEAKQLLKDIVKPPSSGVPAESTTPQTFGDAKNLKRKKKKTTVSDVSKNVEVIDVDVKVVKVKVESIYESLDELDNQYNDLNDHVEVLGGDVKKHLGYQVEFVKEFDQKHHTLSSKVDSIGEMVKEINSRPPTPTLPPAAKVPVQSPPPQPSLTTTTSTTKKGKLPPAAKVPVQSPPPLPSLCCHLTTTTSTTKKAKNDFVLASSLVTPVQLPAGSTTQGSPGFGSPMPPPPEPCLLLLLIRLRSPASQRAHRLRRSVCSGIPSQPPPSSLPLLVQESSTRRNRPSANARRRRGSKIKQQPS